MQAVLPGNVALERPRPGVAVHADRRLAPDLSRKARSCAISATTPYFPLEDAPKLSAADYRLELSGLIADKRPWTVEQLHALPQQSQITRHVCVEGWSMIGKWSGIRGSATFLQRVGADTTGEICRLSSAPTAITSSIDMPTALHPQTIMAFNFADETLPAKYGYPFKVRIPTKLGFKNPKWVTTIYVTNR